MEAKADTDKGDKGASKGTDEPRIEHEPAFTTEDPAKITYVYAVVWFRDGGHQSEVMTRVQVENIRAKSRQKNGPTWTQNWPQMARKTLIRRIANYVPLSTKAIEAIARDDEREFGSPGTATIVETRASRVKDRLAARKQDSPALSEGASPPETSPDAPAEGAAPSESADQQNPPATEICGARSPDGGAVCVGPPDHEGRCADETGQKVWDKA